jgi:anti-anti-sigma regulatory factor
MEIQVKQAQGKTPVTILSLIGDLDASNYLAVIARGRELQQAGSQALILDLGQTPFVSSAGLVAIQSLALLMQGLQPPDPEQGWGALHSLGRGPGSEAGKHMKLLNPQPRVRATLDKVGFLEVLEVCTDLDTAVAAF